MDTMEEIKQELIRRGIRIENAYFIMGYLKGKPHEWQVIFLGRIHGNKQKEIAEENGMTQQGVSWIINELQVITCILET